MKKFLTQKEAVERYGYSAKWFERCRWAHSGPDYVKPNGGKVLYNLEKTDAWFDQFLHSTPKK